jgi:murein DD-endopeptidase MepM/ murein hydrolase activator NlpD
MRTVTRVLSPLIVCLAASSYVALAPAPARAAGDWTWPVQGPVLRGFDPPDSPYGSGHRGIDIGAPIGTVVVAPAPGTVTFAGIVAGARYVSIDHGGGVSSTYSWLSAVMVHAGDVVARGEAIARSGFAHPAEATRSSLHMGVKRDDVYVDPLEYLLPLDLTTIIRLAPLAAA